MGDEEEAEFQAAQQRRRADDLAAIRPIGGGGGGGGDFKYNKRDVARAEARPWLRPRRGRLGGDAAAP